MSDHAEAHAHHDHRKLYIYVFLALGLGTILTVGAAFVDMSRPVNVVVALIIASVKVSLVAYIFMHLNQEARVFYMIALLPFSLFFVMVMLLIPDVTTAETNPLDDPKDAKQYIKYKHETPHAEHGPAH
jgi:cytochrome c oxidase subunit 4